MMAMHIAARAEQPAVMATTVIGWSTAIRPPANPGPASIANE